MLFSLYILQIDAVGKTNDDLERYASFFEGTCTIENYTHAKVHCTCSARTTASSSISSSSTTTTTDSGTFPRLSVLNVSSNGHVECHLEITPQKTIAFGFNCNEMNASEVANKLVSSALCVWPVATCRCGRRRHARVRWFGIYIVRWLCFCSWLKRLCLRAI